MDERVKVAGLCEELVCTQDEAINALTKRHGIMEFAREYIEANRRVKAGKIEGGIISDNALYPLWSEYLRKQV